MCYNKNVPKRNTSSITRNDFPIAEKKTTGSIAHATSILICLSNDVHALTDIARQCNLGKSTVHRILKLLGEAQLVVQDSTNRRYYLGPLITQLASNPITTHEYLIMYANEEMKHLSYISEETVTLDIMIGIQHFSLYEIASKHDLKVTQESRMSGPLQAGASVKVMLSLFNDKQLKVALDTMNITRATERTVTNKELLMAQIKEIRQQGYAISYGERIPGALCISVPINNYVLPVAMSVVGPESRLQLRATAVIEELKASSVRISNNIAGNFLKGGK
jgi:DNA-binding IclR family transcriptional regulator